jgi:hypothetical protein
VEKRRENWFSDAKTPLSCNKIEMFSRKTVC